MRVGPAAGQWDGVQHRLEDPTKPDPSPSNSGRTALEVVGDGLIGLLYVAVTCGPALISSRRYLRWFGLVSLIGVVATALVRVDELTSLWCLYVAMVSVLILEHFRRQRVIER